MYNTPVAGIVPATAGIVALPNTNGNTALLIASIATITIGVAILATSAVRVAMKKANRL